MTPYRTRRLLTGACPRDAGVTRAVELVVLLVLSSGVALAVTEGPVREQARCLATSTIARLESSGGSSCGAAVARTRIYDPQFGKAAPAPAPVPALQAREDASVVPVAPSPPVAAPDTPSGGGAVQNLGGERWLVNDQPAGTQIVPGLGARKRQLVAAGATIDDIAAAMLENHELSTNYKYGDGKGGDSTNFGIFKQNWGMLKESNPALNSLGIRPAGDKINSNLSADIAALQASKAFYGKNWAAGHRNGASGLANPGTQDIKNYTDAVDFIASKLRENPENLTNDKRIWVEVPAI